VDLLYKLDRMTGQQLKAIRKRLGWTQAKVASAVGVSANTVARWERDEVKISEPAARLLQTIKAEKA
jgi:DNA-binding transcriptional regulator YiaG